MKKTKKIILLLNECVKLISENKFDKKDLDDLYLDAENFNWYINFLIEDAKKQTEKVG